jgi:DNA-binding transcriptional LysR family regulator
MDKLRSMEIFIAVVDAGSFTAAAERFDISPVMVGKHIRELEERLGARLLTRTTRRQSLTEIGLQYAERCRAILADIDDAESGAEAMRATPRGTLKLTSATSFGTQCLAPALADYLALYPEVSADLQLNDRFVDIVEEGFDVAVRIGALDDSTLVARPLMPYTMTLCASPAYLKRAGVPRTPEDLHQHECIDYAHWNRRVSWKLKTKDGGEMALPASRFRSNNGQALRMAALRGYGIIMQAELLLGEDIAAGRLVPILQKYLPPPRPIHLVYPRDRTPTPKLTTFVDFMLERFAACEPLRASKKTALHLKSPRTTRNA